MSFLKLSLGLGSLFGLIWLSGCGGGGGGLSYRGLRCPIDHDPISMNPESSSEQTFEKIGESSGSPGENEELLLPSGAYELVSVDLFFNDREEALMIHFKGAFQPSPETATPSAQGSRPVSTESLESRCVRNLKPEMMGLSLGLWGVRAMEVDEDGLFHNIRVGEFGFVYDGGPIRATYADVSTESVEESIPSLTHPAQVYQKGSLRTDVSFFSVTGEDEQVLHYEIRSKMNLGQAVDVYMVTRLRLLED